LGYNTVTHSLPFHFASPAPRPPFQVTPSPRSISCNTAYGLRRTSKLGKPRISVRILIAHWIKDRESSIRRNRALTHLVFFRHLWIRLLFSSRRRRFFLCGNRQIARQQRRHETCNSLSQPSIFSVHRSR